MLLLGSEPSHFLQFSPEGGYNLHGIMLVSSNATPTCCIVLSFVDSLIPGCQGTVRIPAKRYA
ncbi:hypothetical protein BDV18DRAFT_144425 [Aspergillus unguis]